jgi:hypothetical protein
VASRKPKKCVPDDPFDVLTLLLAAEANLRDALQRGATSAYLAQLEGIVEALVSVGDAQTLFTEIEADDE